MRASGNFVGMQPIFADGIDLPLLMVGGMIFLLPLLAFEVVVEALVLRWFWKEPFRELCWLTLRANCWSLAAGVPTAVLVGFIDAAILPEDMPGFFARYALAAAVGSLVYFAVTVFMEGRCAERWAHQEEINMARATLWKGILVANIVTYAVLSPLYYLATKPALPVKELTRDTRWTKNPEVLVVYTNSVSEGFQAIRLDGSTAPMPPMDRLSDWGTQHRQDTCGDLTAFAERGLGSHLRITRGGYDDPLVVVFVSAGLLHYSRFWVGDVRFVGDCNECVFQANGYLYLLDIANQRMGTLVRGNQFLIVKPAQNTNAPPEK